jgi:8-oxo-dGTP pyrophosphatase MutT (NUDIX family)
VEYDESISAVNRDISMNTDDPVFPRRRVAAGAVIQNDEGEVLLVKPHYREGWLIPGGLVEEGEFPFAACVREIKEELGLEIYPTRLLCLDYVGRHGSVPEGVMFIFDGGTIGSSEILSIVLEEGELSDARFMSKPESLDRVSEALRARLEMSYLALQDSTILYLEDGRPAR